MSRKIYLASSWRNLHQERVLELLRKAGHEVYDFKHPSGPDSSGFAWSSIDPAWEHWGPSKFRTALEHPVAEAGFKLDKDALDWSDTTVCLLPCGRSAHLEAGYAAGQGKEVHFLLMGSDAEPRPVPELMYKFGMVNVSMVELLTQLKEPVATFDQARLDLIQEVSELPNINRNLMSHNERELIKLCIKLAARI
jgi:hypothetical protein